MSETKFEADLKTYFPDIYEINQWAKWDKRVWKVFESMLEMGQAKAYGEITVTYQDGRINHIFIKKNVSD